MNTHISEGLGSIRSLLQPAPRGFQSGILGGLGSLELSNLQIRGDLPRPSSFHGLIAVQAPATNGMASSLSAVKTFYDVEVDIRLTAPPIQYSGVAVQLRDVGVDRPRIFYDPDQD